MKSRGKEVKSSFIIKHPPTISTELRWLIHVRNLLHSDFSLNVPLLKVPKLNKNTFDNSYKIWIGPFLIQMHMQVSPHTDL